MRATTAIALVAGFAFAPSVAGEPEASRRCEIESQSESELRERCSIYRKDGSLWQTEIYRNHNAIGPRTSYYADGTPAARETWDAVGSRLLIEDWYPNGKPAERRERIEGSEGFWLGRAQRWYENGQLHWEGTFEEGISPSHSYPCGVEYCEDKIDVFQGLIPRGRVKRYRDDGSLWTDHHYEQGLRRGPQRRHHPGGAVAEEWNANESWTPDMMGYAVDLPEGAYAANYPDGSPRERGSYRAGKPAGAWRRFHPNGATDEERHYDDQGRPHGLWRRFDVHNRLLGESKFEHGQRTPPLPCVDELDNACPLWPPDLELPRLPAEPIGVAAKRCPTTKGPLLMQRSERGPDGSTRLCNLHIDGTLQREDELSADGTLLRSTEYLSEIPFLRFAREPGVLERTTRVDLFWLGKIVEVEKDLRTGVETATEWQPSGLLAERGTRSPTARVGRWTFWGPDGRVSHWIDYENGAEARRIEN